MKDILKKLLPKINLKFSKYLSKLANTSIDISDGLLIDLNKMINTQKYHQKSIMTKYLYLVSEIFLRENSLKKVNLFLMVFKFYLLQTNLTEIKLLRFQE